MTQLPFDSRIIVIGASAGGMDAIRTIVCKLPSDFKCPLFIVWHLAPKTNSLLPDILNRLKTLPAAHAVDKEPIQPGRIYIAPPDKHLVIEKSIVRVSSGSRENRFRPAIDPLFRSAAHAYGNHVVGIVLSGSLDDGTAGLWSIKPRGGVAIVQEPWDAAVAAMPQNALEAVQVDYRLPASGIAQLLVEISKQPFDESGNGKIAAPDNNKNVLEIKIALDDKVPGDAVFGLGKQSRYACPECHGVLTAIKEGSITRFRCHTGHAYSAESLLHSLHETIDNNLWNAIRGIEETVFLLNYMGDHFSADNKPKLAAFYFRKAAEAANRAKVLKQSLHAIEPPANGGTAIEI